MVIKYSLWFAGIWVFKKNTFSTLSIKLTIVLYEAFSTKMIKIFNSWLLIIPSFIWNFLQNRSEQTSFENISSCGDNFCLKICGIEYSMIMVLTMSWKALFLCSTTPFCWVNLGDREIMGVSLFIAEFSECFAFKFSSMITSYKGNIVSLVSLNFFTEKL